MAEAKEDLPPTSAVLMSIYKHIRHSCGKVNRAYEECKRKDKNPAKCMEEGLAVSRCAADLLKDLQTKAPEELRTYVSCLDYYSNKFEKCRKEQAAFEEKVPPEAVQ